MLIHRRRLPRFWLATLPVAAGAVYVAVGLFVPVTSGWSVSTRSADVEFFNVYKLPFTGIVCRRSTWRRVTPVGVVLAKHVVRRGGPDSFELVEERDRSGTTGLGIGAHAIATIQNVAVADFLDQLLTFSDPATADRWIGLALDPATSDRVRVAVLTSDLPVGGFADRARFARWWHTAEPRIEAEYAAP